MWNTELLIQMLFVLNDDKIAIKLNRAAAVAAVCYIATHRLIYIFLASISFQDRRYDWKNFSGYESGND